MSQLFPMVGWLFAAIGLLVTVRGVLAWRRRQTDVASWPQVEGLVVSDSIQQHGGSTARIDFTTLVGERVRTSVTSAVDFGLDARGRTVPVWYDPANPRNAHASVHVGDNSLVPTVILGGGLIGIGLLFALVV